jgi:hypothetical protein
MAGDALQGEQDPRKPFPFVAEVGPSLVGRRRQAGDVGFQPGDVGFVALDGGRGGHQVAAQGLGLGQQVGGAAFEAGGVLSAAAERPLHLLKAAGGSRRFRGRKTGTARQDEDRRQ